MSSRLRGFYNDEIVPEMTKKFSYKNKLAVPKIEKIIINMGVGEAKDNAKVYPDKNQLLQKQKNLLQHLNFVKVCL